ncbi:hypothetical protein GCM10018787_06070 [Streptomyces thermodiastaticus]|nr:hypothetical protein GCM10018787_06070 [Streptomyces thermodiastaticus]
MFPAQLVTAVLMPTPLPPVAPGPRVSEANLPDATGGPDTPARLPAASRHARPPPRRLPRIRTAARPSAGPEHPASRAERGPGTAGR